MDARGAAVALGGEAEDVAAGVWAGIGAHAPGRLGDGALRSPPHRSPLIRASGEMGPTDRTTDTWAAFSLWPATLSSPRPRTRASIHFQCPSGPLRSTFARKRSSTGRRDCRRAEYSPWLARACGAYRPGRPLMSCVDGSSLPQADAAPLPWSSGCATDTGAGSHLGDCYTRRQRGSRCCRGGSPVRAALCYFSVGFHCCMGFLNVGLPSDVLVVRWAD